MWQTSEDVHMHQGSANPIREMLHGNGPQRDSVVRMYVSSILVGVECLCACFTQADLHTTLQIYTIHDRYMIICHTVPANALITATVEQVVNIFNEIQLNEIRSEKLEDIHLCFFPQGMLLNWRCWVAKRFE